MKNMKTDTQSQSDQRRYQYFTGAPTNINGLAQSSIDQHRNSIQQRIANLQSKITKKYNPQLQTNNPTSQTQSDNYVNTRRMYQYGQSNQQINYQIPNSQQNFQSIYTKSNMDLKSSLANSILNKNVNYKYLSNTQQLNDQSALRQKYKFNSIISNQGSKYPVNELKTKVNYQKMSKIEHDEPKQKETIKQRIVGKKIKNNSYQQKNQNHKPQSNHTSNNRAYQSSQRINQRKYPLSNSNNKQTQLKKNQHILNQNTINLNNTKSIQDNFHQLNKTISNLKNYSAISYPIKKYQNKNFQQQTNQGKTYSYMTEDKNSNNNQLFQMMKSILVGQQRLEKQLNILKNKPNQINQIKNNLEHSKKSEKQIIQSYNYHKQNLDHQVINKSPIKQRNKLKSARRLQQYLNKSPKQLQKTKSPRLSKSSLQKTVGPSKQTSAIKRNRAKSAINPKKTGKIAKNKQRFYQLYKQAQTNKKLSPSNQRIIISNEVVSSVWQKIKVAIQRSNADDAQTAVIYHENNRYVNDQLVNRIQLQKKLKGDLIKKIYEMCENKCLYK